MHRTEFAPIIFIVFTQMYDKVKMKDMDIHISS